MNTFMNNLKNETNYSLTENGGLTHKTTTSTVYDLFAFGGAYRNRSDEDCILLFKNAFEEERILALKCLFYLGDCRGGQGERRFFRLAFHWLCENYPRVAEKNLALIPVYRRWDDLIYSTVDTVLWNDTMKIIKDQLLLDINSKTPSLLAKWLPSENASAQGTKRVATKVRESLGWSHRQYRKGLSELRSRINIVEKLMSENRWDEIEFDKIPSKAGLIYRNAFARRDIIAKKYESFAKDKTTKVNADTLYPYEIVEKVSRNVHCSWWGNDPRAELPETERAMLNKYWENLPDYLGGNPCKMMCVVDTSASMRGNPLNVAISLGMYCAERIGGDFKDHFISFSHNPKLIKVEGVDFCDKVARIYAQNLCEDTNLEGVFNLLLKMAKDSNPEDIPETITIISDMEINSGCEGFSWGDSDARMRVKLNTMMENMRQKWAKAGFKLPKLVYWNVEARNNNILDLGPNVSYVSGLSPVIFKQVMTGKTGYDLMLEAICSKRYEDVTV